MKIILYKQDGWKLIKEPGQLYYIEDEEGNLVRENLTGPCYFYNERTARKVFYDALNNPNCIVAMHRYYSIIEGNYGTEEIDDEENSFTRDPIHYRSVIIDFKKAEGFKNSKDFKKVEHLTLFNTKEEAIQNSLKLKNLAVDKGKQVLKIYENTIDHLHTNYNIKNLTLSCAHMDAETISFHFNGVECKFNIDWLKNN